MAMRFRWTTHDGEDRHAHAWEDVETRAVVACVHGLSGSGEQFHPLPQRIPGFSFYALDLRGQGSDTMAERRGIALDFQNQMRDIAAFVAALRQAHAGRPVFLMGESMGSLLSAGFAGWSATDGRPHHAIDGVILSVPVVGLVREVPGFLRHILRFAAGLLPRARLSPSRFVNGKTVSPPLTRNRAYQDSLREQPHHISNFSLGFLLELSDLIDSSETLARNLHLPALVLAAGNDCFVRADQIQTWFEKIPSSDKSLRLYPDAYHLLWHDWDRDLVISDIAEWLSARV